jgi:PAS domain S-box-containing protein
MLLWLNIERCAQVLYGCGKEAGGKKPVPSKAINDLIRFSEAIDQAISESVTSYSFEKEQQTRVFDTILSSSTDLSLTFDLEGRFAYANKALIEFLKLPLDKIVGKTFVDLELPAAAELQRQIQAVMSTKEKVHGEMPYTTASGEWRFYDYIFVPVLNKEGAVEAVAGTIRDITERKLAEDKNWQKANYDLLTGLPNRRLFLDRLEQDVKHAGRLGAPIALLFIDLDHFKEANDRFGHEAGDLLLRSAADRIRSCVRETDTGSEKRGAQPCPFLLAQSEESVGAHSEESVALVSFGHSVPGLLMSVRGLVCGKF